MDKRTVLVAESSGDFRQALVLALEETYRVHSCATGKEALSLLEEINPDALVLDLMLPEIDGITLLENAAPENVKILATTSLLSPYVQESAQALGIDYIMRKPCSAENVAMRLADILRQDTSLSKQFSGILDSLGFTARQNGTACLLTALELYVQNPAQALTKELYPAAGKRCQPKASGKKVEKDIRYAITCAWNRGDRTQWLRYFPQGRKPTNGEFIMRIVEAVKGRK